MIKRIAELFIEWIGYTKFRATIKQFFSFCEINYYDLQEQSLNEQEAFYHFKEDNLKASRDARRNDASDFVVFDVCL